MILTLLSLTLTLLSVPLFVETITAPKDLAGTTNWAAHFLQVTLLAGTTH